MHNLVSHPWGRGGYRKKQKKKKKKKKREKEKEDEEKEDEKEEEEEERNKERKDGSKKAKERQKNTDLWLVVVSCVVLYLEHVVQHLERVLGGQPAKRARG